MKVQLKAKGNCTPLQVQYDESFARYYREITDMQLNDPALWSLLVRQFSLKTDACDGGWRGEFWGKMMRGSCMVYSCTKDQAFYQTLENAVRSLLSMQQITGRISSYLEEKELQDWDVWCRKYVMLGLEHFYEICQDETLKARVMDSLIRHANYILNHIGEEDGKKSIIETSKMHGALNSVSIMQPYVRLYKYTGDESYLRFAEMLADTQWRENGIFSLAEQDALAPFEYPYKKAYEMISCFEGLLELYEVCGDERYLKVCTRFADKVLATDFTIVGGSGCYDEYFNNSTETQVQYTEIHKQETCVTVTLMKFLSALYKHTKNVAYVEAIEKSFFNAYLGAFINQRNDAYLPVPMFYSYSPVYKNPRWTLMGGGKNIAPYAKCGCCVAIGAAGLDPFPQIGAVLEDKTIVINFFVAGKYELLVDGKCIQYTIESNYPYEGNIKIKFTDCNFERIILQIRKPSWSSVVVCQKQGKEIECVENNGYLVLGKVSAGDEFEVKFDMPIQLHSANGLNEGTLYCVTKGPIVLCADGNFTDLDKKYSLRKDDAGKPLYCEIDATTYDFSCKDGETLRLKEYKSVGKNYYEPETISVWLHLHEGDDQE